MRVTMIWLVAVLVAFAIAGSAGSAPDDKVPALDFATEEIPAPWAVSAGWVVEKGELHGVGPGGLEFRRGVREDFAFTMRSWTEEKANVEIYLIDGNAKPVYTFAFLGRYHSVLDGVKSCMLKGNRFVAVDSSMWIFPGRMFTFEVRRAKNQYQMFLNGVLGPVFRDDAPPSGLGSLQLRVSILTEGGQDKARVDDVSITFLRSGR